MADSIDGQFLNFLARNIEFVVTSNQAIHYGLIAF